jgi:3-deoxy-D-manno-octulosonic-acid transferase
MFIIYDILLVFLYLIYLPVFLVKRKMHQGFAMRLGFFSEEFINRLKETSVIWIHAVSVGETNSTQPLVDALIRKYPQKHILISTVTATGNERAKQIVGDKATVIYSPLDISFIVNKFIKAVKPEIFIIVETEIWPNLLSRLHANGIPVGFINGRISANSYKGYSFIKPFIRRLLSKVRFFMMQSEIDAQRIISLGANIKSVNVAGNTKYDIKEDFERIKSDAKVIKEKFKIKDDDLVIIGGSTHYPEEKYLLKAYQKICTKFKNLKLILAPRHTSRSAYICNLAGRTKLSCKRYSDEPGNNLSSAGICILDVMGKLKAAYSLADICFVGGTLAPIGGHNIIEPAAFKKPIIIGPHVDNCRYLAEYLIKEEAIIMVEDETELEEKLDYLLSEHTVNKELGRKAMVSLEGIKGATSTILNKLDDVI